jgi:hypothetical protein
MTKRLPLARFIAQERITMAQPEWVDRNPNMDLDGWSQTASHYKVRLRHKGKTLTTYFSLGSAHTSEPELASVLSCLADDAAGAVNAQGFEDWCSEYGYDTDSRKAERTYNTIIRQAGKLESFLGPEAYSTLLWNTDRE